MSLNYNEIPGYIADANSYKYPFTTIDASSSPGSVTKNKIVFWRASLFIDNCLNIFTCSSAVVGMDVIILNANSFGLPAEVNDETFVVVFESWMPDQPKFIITTDKGVKTLSTNACTITVSQTTISSEGDKTVALRVFFKYHYFRNLRNIALKYSKIDLSRVGNLLIVNMTKRNCNKPMRPRKITAWA